jgi:hypothetical protein
MKSTTGIENRRARIDGFDDGAAAGRADCFDTVACKAALYRYR